jgi:hypothetical protein
MATFRELLPANIKTQRSYLNQLIDVLQEDISASVSRRKFQVWISGCVGPGVTSSLHQTVYDQDFTLQTANAIFDVTMGLRPGGTTVTTSQTGLDAAGKELFPSSSLMMREKIDIYRQFAQTLLGDNTQTFVSPFDSTDASNIIDVPLFIAFKRLFARDSIKRETVAIRFHQTASINGPTPSAPAETFLSQPNLYSTTVSGSAIYTDIGSATNKLTTFGGQVGNIINASNVSNNVGLMFYDRGIAVLDLNKITSASQYVSGTIDAMAPNGYTTLGGPGTQTYAMSKFIPDFVVSASLDNIIDHVCACRFGSVSLTAVTFQNVTNINSSLIFCQAGADEFNYSSNPTYTDSENRIQVIDPGSEDTQTSFTFITSVGLYDANDNLLAVAKLSRPIEKSSERELSFRIRLDY